MATEARMPSLLQRWSDRKPAPGPLLVISRYLRTTLWSFNEHGLLSMELRIPKHACHNTLPRETCVNRIPALALMYNVSGLSSC